MLEDMIFAAEAGGAIIKKYFGAVLDKEEKASVADFRTKADLESEQAILAVLKEKFPDYTIFSEEAGIIDRQSEFMLVVDPLDGTNNFTLGIPNFSVSIGLLQGDRCIAGVIYVPLLNQIYSAEDGKGAFCNGRKLSVSIEQSLEKTTISYMCNYVNDPKFELELLNNLQSLHIKRYLTNWSPAFDYCLLASGKTEVVINNGTDLYDYIAGKIIAREAGAIITDFSGGSQNDRETSICLASNSQQIHDQILKVLP